MHAPVSLKAFILVTIWHECFLTIDTLLDNKYFVAQILAARELHTMILINSNI